MPGVEDDVATVLADKVVKTEILGNDGIHEWGRTHYQSGLVVEWWENLRARNELFQSIVNQGNGTR